MTDIGDSNIYSNIGLAKKVLQNLAKRGVSEIVICSGARNSPFVVLLEKCSGLKLHFFFEERSAAFFALGRIQALNAPVAVLTTSGTAVAELLPATIEAHYSGLPLILVSADRPKNYRGSGAPQSIDQLSLLSVYCEEVIDIDVESDHSEAKISGLRPVHMNVCFDEPLIDEEVETWRWEKRDLSVDSIDESSSGLSPAAKNEQIEPGFSKPLILVGGLLERDRVFVKSELLRINAPYYLEATSGLREDSELSENHIASSDRMVSKMPEEGSVDGVIRIGSVPTLRVWRDLEKKYRKIPVMDFSLLSFSGHAREKSKVRALETLRLLPVFAGNVHWKERDKEFSRAIGKIIEKYPRSEPSMFRSLSKLVKSDELLYLGNSMPIREWDLAANHNICRKAFANRGANGIDGQLSTFLGLSQGKKSWGVFGDLTTLYDLSSLWSLDPSTKAQVVVVNNSGGQIFSRIFESSQFRNEHSIEFSHWAAMWKVKYMRWQEIPSSHELETSAVIEIVPDSDQTMSFWREYDALEI